MYAYVYWLTFVLLKMYLNAHFLWHECTCSIRITVSFICWCITNHILKPRQLEWLKAITFPLFMNLQFGQVLVRTLCFCPTGQPLGWLKHWGPESSSFTCISGAWAWSLKQLGAGAAGAPSLAIFLWSSHGIFPAWSTQGSCTSHLYLGATRSVGEKRKEKRESTLGGNCVAPYYSASAPRGFPSATFCLLSRS